MRTRYLLALAFSLFLCGCEAMKKDKIIGDDPWQPGGYKSTKSS